MDWSNPAGAAVAGAMGLIGSALNYKYQSKLQDKQNQFNLDMWNLQNEYNSPQAQMKRYEEAGLNPALIYSQGNPGNAASAPVQGVPEAPELSQDMRELGQAFNIEGLKTAIANRKKAQAEARQATAVAEDVESDNDALRRLYWDYSFDPRTGQFVYDGGIASMSDGSVESKPIIKDGGMARAKAMRILADNYRTNSLLVPRANLIGTQGKLNTYRTNLLAPQIRMANFNATPWRMSTNFWVGNVKNGVQALSGFIPKFSFKKNL